MIHWRAPSGWSFFSGWSLTVTLTRPENNPTITTTGSCTGNEGPILQSTFYIFNYKVYSILYLFTLISVYIILLMYKYIAPYYNHMYIVSYVQFQCTYKRPLGPHIHPLNPPLRCFYLQEEAGEWADWGPVTAAFCLGYLQCQTGKLKNKSVLNKIS